MNVLIIDDHELFSEGLMLLLNSMKQHLEIDFVNSCGQALQLDDKDKVQVVLLDYNLPDGAGVPVLKTVRQNFPAATVIIISSDDSPGVIQNSIANGASGFIPKSSSRNVLIAALELVLSGGTYLPPQALEVLNIGASESKKKTLPTLTDRQIDVLNHAVRGTSNKVIALQLGIAEGTVKAHLFSAYKLMGVKNRTEAVLAFAKYQAENSHDEIIVR